MPLDTDSCPPHSFLSPKGAAEVLILYLGTGGEGEAGWEVVPYVLAPLSQSFPVQSTQVKPAK